MLLPHATLTDSGTVSQIEIRFNNGEGEPMAEHPDSDEEANLLCHDAVKEILSKSPEQRREDEIETLLEFVQNLKAFCYLNYTTQKKLCSVAVLRSYNSPGSLVFDETSKTDPPEWLVLLEGSIALEGEKGDLQPTVSIGDVLMTSNVNSKHKQYRGRWVTTSVQCHLLVVDGEDYTRARRQEEVTTVTERGGADNMTVLVREIRWMAEDAREEHLIIQATPEKLLEQLSKPPSTCDATFAEDFFLTHHIFLQSTRVLTTQLEIWFRSTTDSKLRERVSELLRIWVSQRFEEFESSPELLGFLDRIISAMKQHRMKNSLKLLYKSCSKNARLRKLTLLRDSSESPVGLTTSLDDVGQAIYVGAVESGGNAEQAGFRVGDEFLEVNNKLCSSQPVITILDSINNSLKLDVKVRNNLQGFYGDINALTPPQLVVLRDNPDVSPEHQSSSIAGMLSLPHGRTLSMPPSPSFLTTDRPRSGSGHNCTLRIQSISDMTSPSVFRKFMLRRKSSSLIDQEKKLSLRSSRSAHTSPIHASSLRLPSSPPTLFTLDPPPVTTTGRRSFSHQSSLTTFFPWTSGSPSGANSASGSPGTTGLTSFFGGSSAQMRGSINQIQEMALRVFFRTNTSNTPSSPQPPLVAYVCVSRSTTAKLVVAMAIAELGINLEGTTPDDWAISEVWVVDGDEPLTRQHVIKSDAMDLVTSLKLNARYYLKPRSQSSIFIDDADKSAMLAEARISLFDLPVEELALQLFLHIISLQRTIPPTELLCYVCDPVSGGETTYPNLAEYMAFINRLVSWVTFEVCSEQQSVTRRAKIIKRFIRLAKLSRQLNNVEVFFALINGLHSAEVTRLKLTWEKVSGRNLKTFKRLSNLLEVTGNMRLIRSLHHENTPVVGMAGLVTKDLTALHENRATWSPSPERLVNWEKLRLMAQRVRSFEELRGDDDLWSGDLERAVILLRLRLARCNSNLSPSNLQTNSTTASGSVTPTESKWKNLNAATTLKRTVRRLSSALTTRRIAEEMWENDWTAKRCRHFLTVRLPHVLSMSQAMLLSHQCEPPLIPILIPSATILGKTANRIGTAGKSENLLRRRFSLDAIRGTAIKPLTATESEKVAKICDKEGKNTKPTIREHGVKNVKQTDCLSDNWQQSSRGSTTSSGDRGETGSLSSGDSGLVSLPGNNRQHLSKDSAKLDFPVIQTRRSTIEIVPDDRPPGDGAEQVVKLFVPNRRTHQGSSGAESFSSCQDVSEDDSASSVSVAKFSLIVTETNSMSRTKNSDNDTANLPTNQTERIH